MAYSLPALLITGVVLGFMGRWWGMGWIWVSLVGLIVLSGLMSFLGRMHLKRVRHAIGVLTYDDSKKKQTQASPANWDELTRALNAGRAGLLVLAGLGGQVVIVWLKLFKPF